MILIFTSFGAFAAQDTEYLCDLRIGSGQREVLVIRDRPVRIESSKGQASAQAAFVDAFEDINTMIQKKVYAPALFLIQTYWVVGAREMRPELSLGFYYYNRLKPSEPSEVSKATGDARTQVRLNARLPNDMPIEFSCRNKEYDI